MPRQPRPRWWRWSSTSCPAVLSVEQALDPASPLVQDPSLRPDDADARTNVLRQWTFGWGEAAGLPAPGARTGVPVPDGDALRDRAARVRRAPDRGRHHHRQPDPASVRAAAGRGRGAGLAAVEGPDRGAGSWRRIRRERMAEVRAAGGDAGASSRPPRPARPDARGDVPGGRGAPRRAFARGRRSTATGTSCRRRCSPTF